MTPRRSRGQRTTESPPFAPKRDLAWWSAQPGGPKRALSEFQSLDPEMQGRLLKVIQRFFAGESRRTDLDKLDDHVYEWRTRKGTNNFRVLFFNWGHICVALTAFYKNQQRTPPADLKRANDRRKAWLRTRGSSPPSDGWSDS